MSTKQTKKFIPVAEPDLGPLEESYLLDALRSGWISSTGHFLDEFESKFAKFCEADNAIAVCNGTAALDLALLAVGVLPGDEVIVPSLTYVSVAAAVRHVGASPIFVDCEPEIGTMDPEAVRAAISPRTRAIIPVHLYGHPVDMDPIMEMAESRGIMVIEDAAEAHGARYKGKRVGGIGHLAIFSFFGNKIITTGEGGMVLAKDRTVASRVRILKDHGMDPGRKYWHAEVGYNFRLTNLQAAIGCAQLERYQSLVACRRQMVDRYRTAFQAIDGLLINPAKPWAEVAPWLVCAILPVGITRAENTALQAILRERGFDTRPYFYPANLMPPYCSYPVISRGGAGSPVASALSNRGLNLPSPNWIDTDCIESIRDITTAYLESKQ